MAEEKKTTKSKTERSASAPSQTKREEGSVSREARAVSRYLKISPTKVRGVLDLVRGESVKEARRVLRFSPKRAARICLKVVDSAVANASKGKNFNDESWIISDIRADKGPIFRRKLDYKARFGRGLIATPSTHISVKIREVGKEDKDGS